MSDRYPAYIAIHGPCPDAILPHIVVAADMDHVGLDWEEGPPDLDELKETISNTDSGPLEFHDNEAPYGEIRCMTQLCHDFGLGYIHHSDAYFEYEAMTSWWQPGMEGVQQLATGQDGSPVISVHTLLRLRKKAGSLEALAEDLDALLAELDVPDMAPFTSITGAEAVAWLMTRLRQTAPLKPQVAIAFMDALDHYREENVECPPLQEGDLVALLTSENKEVRQRAVLLVSALRADDGPQPETATPEPVTRTTR